ncbi:hypothetical protein SeLEV6574_g03984 [Synchytrium endobioticum]|uniref:Altered inheritance of mitochondria protein 41 n=1 Tax=Synchytrium endobioticum TaxID=286115 RepID=A0A507D199_9FUNG|nr:hypothetical protein SeLEV6574_g03984 [Synchytrium endobioticum]
MASLFNIGPKAFRLSRLPVSIRSVSLRHSTTSLNDVLMTRLKADLKTFMKSKSMSETNVVKSILADITYSQKSASSNATNVMSVLQKAVTKRRDAAESYKVAKEETKAQKEQSEAEWIAGRYIPKALDVESLTTEVQKVIQAVEAKSVKDVGKVMKGMADLINSGLATSKSTMDVIKLLLPK